jgi:hypothetical protein
MKGFSQLLRHNRYFPVTQQFDGPEKHPKHLYGHLSDNFPDSNKLTGYVDYENSTLRTGEAVTFAADHAPTRRIRTMIISKKLVAGVLGGMLILASYALVWAGSDNAAAPTQSATSNQSLLGALTPLLTDAATHKATPNCKPDTLYSGHDVVGDSEACFVSHVDVRAAAGGTNPGVSGAF